MLRDNGDEARCHVLNDLVVSYRSLVYGDHEGSDEPSHWNSKRLIEDIYWDSDE